MISINHPTHYLGKGGELSQSAIIANLAGCCRACD
jgi:hypothetical protein